MPQSNDLSRSLAAFDQDRTLIAVIEMSQSNWLVAGLVPGLERRPLKKLSPDQDALLKLVQRWRNEAAQAGREITRIVIAYEAGRDGFWLARWLRRRGIEAYVIHPSSVAVSREHRRAKTDRLDTELLMRAVLGWLRGEKRHCSMAAIPTIEDEDAKRPSREHEKLVGDRTRLEQVVINLVQNAIEAVDGRPDGRVTLTAGLADGSIELTVADNGPGLDPTVAASLFTPFASAKPEGLGLGLAIARDIAREFGGDITHRPGPTGATFVARLKTA